MSILFPVNNIITFFLIHLSFSQKAIDYFYSNLLNSLSNDVSNYTPTLQSRVHNFSAKTELPNNQYLKSLMCCSLSFSPHQNQLYLFVKISISIKGKIFCIHSKYYRFAPLIVINAEYFFFIVLKNRKVVPSLSLSSKFAVFFLMGHNNTFLSFSSLLFFIKKFH